MIAAGHAAEKLPSLATADDIAAELGIARPTVYQLVRDGLIPHTRIGRRMVRFDRVAVRRWLEAGGSVTGASDS